MTTTAITPLSSTTSARKLFSFGAIAGLAIFVGGWIVAEALEGHGYSVARHDISDLGALTAHHASLILVTDALGGLLVIAFALGALLPALAVRRRGAVLGAVAVAMSLPALGTFNDTFFRLDCRAADHGCSVSQATTSWHGKAHIISFAIAAVATAVAPFLLARRMQLLDGWRHLARPTRLFGIGFIVAIVVTSALTNSSVGGIAQRAVIFYTCGGLALLAWRTSRTA